MITDAEIRNAERAAEKRLLSLGALRDQQHAELGEIVRRIAETEASPGRTLDEKVKLRAEADALRAVQADAEASMAKINVEISEQQRVIDDAAALRTYRAETERVSELAQSARDRLVAALGAVADAVARVSAMDEAHQGAMAAQQALDARANELLARGVSVLPARLVDDRLIFDATASDVSKQEAFRAMRDLRARHGANITEWR